MMIDVDKFVASIMKCLWNPHREDAYMCRHWINKALDAQGLKFENGEIVKSQRTIVAEAKEAIFDNEDEKIRKIIKDSLQFYFDGRLSEGTNDTDYAMCITWLEKQGEQKPILDFKASNWYVSKVDGKIHDMTYNPTDKKELKKLTQSVTKRSEQVWSEEDEIGFADTLWAIQQARTIAKDENDMGNLWYAEDWLKSLKQRVGGK